MLEALTLEAVGTMARGALRPAESSVPRWLVRVEELLRARPEAEHSLRSLALVAGVHPGHLMRTFRVHYGRTVGDFVRSLRIEKACVLLAEGDDSVSIGEIAHRVGFSDQSAFGKAFRRTVGATPGEFRRAPFGVRITES